MQAFNFVGGEAAGPDTPACAWGLIHLFVLCLLVVYDYLYCYYSIYIIMLSCLSCDPVNHIIITRCYWYYYYYYYYCY